MHYVDKTGFDHTDLIASTFPVLGFKVGTIMPGLMDSNFHLCIYLITYLEVLIIHC